jgi:hypothetical protein
LTGGHYRHVAALLIMVGAITFVPFFAGGAAFGHHGVNAASFLAGLAARIVTASFSALAGAVLYFDLLVRAEAEPQPALEGATMPSAD